MCSALPRVRRGWRGGCVWKAQTGCPAKFHANSWWRGCCTGRHRRPRARVPCTCMGFGLVSDCSAWHSIPNAQQRFCAQSHIPLARWRYGERFVRLISVHRVGVSRARVVQKSVETLDLLVLAIYSVENHEPRHYQGESLFAFRMVWALGNIPITCTVIGICTANT